jgi:hypothetical protein
MSSAFEGALLKMTKAEFNSSAEGVLLKMTMAEFSSSAERPQA